MSALRYFRAIILFNIIVLFLSAYCDKASAQLTNSDLPNRKGVKFGDVIVHSAFKTSEELDANIFLNDTDTKFDAITLLNPSVGLELPLRNNSLSVDYDAGIYLYGKYDNQNHVDHRIRGMAEFNLAKHKITINDTFRIFTDRAADENSNRIERTINNLRAGIAAQFELLGFDIGYSNKLEAYGSEEISFASLTYKDRNRFTNTIDATISYRFLPKTSLLIENDLGFINYYNSREVPDSYYNETVLGIKGEWLAKANVNFKAGIRFQNYDSSTLISDKDYIGPVLRGGFDYNMTQDDMLTFRAEKTVYESIYSNMNYYGANLIGLNYQHRFNDKVSGGLFSSYQLHLYPGTTTENGVTGKRYDNYLGGGVSLRYDIRRWISMEAKYEYKQRISKFDTFDYIDNLMTVRGTVGF